LGKKARKFLSSTKRQQTDLFSQISTITFNHFLMMWEISKAKLGAFDFNGKAKHL
jgi:hypothetical protein